MQRVLEDDTSLLLRGVKRRKRRLAKRIKDMQMSLPKVSNLAILAFDCPKEIRAGWIKFRQRRAQKLRQRRVNSRQRFCDENVDRAWGTSMMYREENRHHDYSHDFERDHSR